MARKGVKLRFCYELLFWLALVSFIASYLISNQAMVVIGMVVFLISVFLFEIAYPYEERPQIKSYLVRCFLAIAILAVILHKIRGTILAIVEDNQPWLLYIVFAVILLVIVIMLVYRFVKKIKHKREHGLRKKLPHIKFKHPLIHEEEHIKHIRPSKPHFRLFRFKPKAEIEHKKLEIKKHELKALKVPEKEEIKKKEPVVLKPKRKKSFKKPITILLILLLPLVMVFGLIYIRKLWFYGLVGFFVLVFLVRIAKRARPKKEAKPELEEEPEEEELEEEEKVIKITAPRYETDFDRMLDLIEKKGSVKISEIAEHFNIDVKKAEEWGHILESHGLLSIHYPPVGEPRLVQVKKK